MVGLDNVPALVSMSEECLKTWVSLDSGKLEGGDSGGGGGFAAITYAVADVNKPLDPAALAGTPMFDAIHVGVAMPNVPECKALLFGLLFGLLKAEAHLARAVFVGCLFFFFFFFLPVFTLSVLHFHHLVICIFLTRLTPLLSLLLLPFSLSPLLHNATCTLSALPPRYPPHALPTTTALLDVLSVGGRLLLPILKDASMEQTLTLVTKQQDGSTTSETLGAVMFSPNRDAPVASSEVPGTADGVGSVLDKLAGGSLDGERLGPHSDDAPVESHYVQRKKREINGQLGEANDALKAWMTEYKATHGSLPQLAVMQADETASQALEDIRRCKRMLKINEGERMDA